MVYGSGFLISFNLLHNENEFTSDQFLQNQINLLNKRKCLVVFLINLMFSSFFMAAAAYCVVRVCLNGGQANNNEHKKSAAFHSAGLNSS